MKYAVIETSSITIPGDQRSRDAPGHGYPEHTETVTHFREFASEQELTTYIARQNNSYSKFRGRVIRFEELTVQTEVVVSLK